MLIVVSIVPPWCIDADEASIYLTLLQALPVVGPTTVVVVVAQGSRSVISDLYLQRCGKNACREERGGGDLLLKLKPRLSRGDEVFASP